MGGHGALTLYLKNPTQYKSASAFSPICHPTKCPWGEKAFGNYLDGGVDEGKAHDATELLLKAGGPDKRKLAILIDSGLGDNFYKEKQLLPEDFANAAMEQGYTDEHVTIRLQDGYDHSCAYTASSCLSFMLLFAWLTHRSSLQTFSSLLLLPSTSASMPNT